MSDSSLHAVSLTACILYHSQSRLSRGFWNFFQVFSKLCDSLDLSDLSIISQPSGFVKWFSKVFWSFFRTSFAFTLLRPLSRRLTDYTTPHPLCQYLFLKKPNFFGFFRYLKFLCCTRSSHNYIVFSRDRKIFFTFTIEFHSFPFRYQSHDSVICPVIFIITQTEGYSKIFCGIWKTAQHLTALSGCAILNMKISDRKEAITWNWK